MAVLGQECRNAILLSTASQLTLSLRRPAMLMILLSMKERLSSSRNLRNSFHSLRLNRGRACTASSRPLSLNPRLGVLDSLSLSVLASSCCLSLIICCCIFSFCWTCMSLSIFIFKLHECLHVL